MSHANLSRRAAILAGAASLPALALPAVANAISDPDAELLGLADQLGATIHEWTVQNAIDRRRSDADKEGDDASEEFWGGFNNRQELLMNEIFSYKAKTAAGLALQVRAMTLWHFELWDKADYHRDHRLFVEAVCAFVGVTPVPLAVQSHEGAASVI
jgi:hypothetical protein